MGIEIKLDVQAIKAIEEAAVKYAEEAMEQVLRRQDVCTITLSIIFRKAITLTQVRLGLNHISQAVKRTLPRMSLWQSSKRGQAYDFT